ncbi:MAG TPA: Calx-beta domain-containing protein, partial [Candidatus Paceibacterota bacterium]|nr:Calx-beta domain-containing protein [Candidatus Paceibacterota bacterium]
MNRQIFHLAKSGVLRRGSLSHLGLLVALCGNIQADGWLERERTFYQLREDEGVVRVGLVWGGDGPSSPVTVEYATQDLTAKAGEDYVPTAGTLEFAASDKVKCVTIPILNDSVAEGDEEFYVGFSNVKGADNSSIGVISIMILDNDRSPGVQFESETYWVMADEGTLTLRLFRNNDLDHGAFTVDYRTHDGTAVAGQDYVETKGTLAFAPGELVQSVTIPVLTDGLAEW